MSVKPAQYELTATVRQNVGRGASRRLRREEQLPAILYGAEQPPIALSLSHHDVLKALENKGFYSHILTLSIKKNDQTQIEKQQVVLKDLHRHPFKPKILHMDFLRINPKEKIVITVPLHFIGENHAPGVKQGGIFNHLLSSVEISCLPADLPEFIEVDVSHLVLEQIIHLSELKLPERVELTAFLHDHPELHDTSVIKLSAPKISQESPEETSEISADKTKK